jgi:hypothetical protein
MVAIYMFEDCPGQDGYMPYLRSGMKDPWEPKWVQEYDNTFVAAVAKLKFGTTCNEKEYNIVLSKNKEPIPRQLFVRALQYEHYDHWGDSEHKEYTRGLVHKLMQEVRKGRNDTPNEKWRHKDIYIDEDKSFAGLHDLKYPLGMYMQDNVMTATIMPILFGDDLDEDWAIKYPEMVDHFFMRGGTAASNALGVDPKYVYEEEIEPDEEVTTLERIDPKNVVQQEEIQPDEEVTRTLERIEHEDDTTEQSSEPEVNAIQVKKKRKRILRKSNPHIDDEAEEDAT